ncbi:4193_t:CDS:10 [Ambispora gerdemannii]|uniref:4193_t:CDS:1 n=1 Tax=Ambispora gerdemannii TaxID=144530 RepID=A0A9N9CYY8_9GLOM|nr:4193_t:CDS:10 [Ambispora gerdemannii]
MSKKYLDEAVDSYFTDTPPSEWSYLGFLEALKSTWMSTDRYISFAENSALRKRYCNFLRILSEERDSERGRTATLLLQKVRNLLSPLFSESGVVQPRRGAVPTPSMTLFIIVIVNLLNGLVVKLTFFCKDETRGVKEFWECVNLDKKVTKERITIKKKTELDALKVLESARTNEADGLVDQFNIERKQKKFQLTTDLSDHKVENDDYNKDNVENNKTGPFPLTEMIEQTFNGMKKERMWRLSTGKYVEEELFELGKKLIFEHAVHSFILDVDDGIIFQHFSEAELDEIDCTPGPQVPELSEEITGFLNKFAGKFALIYLTGERRKMGRRIDWILRSISNGDRDEFGAGEAGKSWVDKNGTKFLKEAGLKLPKTLKDMLVKLMEKAGWDEESRAKIQTIGIIHAGLMIMTVCLDNPKGYICRVQRGELMEVPDNAENFPYILTILASVLIIKGRVSKRPLDKNEDRISPCLSTPKKAKVCAEAYTEQSYPSSPCPGSSSQCSDLFSYLE